VATKLPKISNDLQSFSKNKEGDRYLKHSVE